MGMFAKDKEIGNNIQNVFKFGDMFILWNVADGGEVATTLGPAKKTLLTVSKLDDPANQFECATLASAIASKAAEADPDDFPCVVQLLKVPSNFGNDAVVLQWVKDYSPTGA